MNKWVTFTYLVPDERSDTRTVTIPFKDFRDWSSTVAYYVEGRGAVGVLKSDIVGEVVMWSK